MQLAQAMAQVTLKKRRQLMFYRYTPGGVAMTHLLSDPLLIMAGQW